jgi:phasin family protein
MPVQILWGHGPSSGGQPNDKEETTMSDGPKDTPYRFGSGAMNPDISRLFSNLKMPAIPEATALLDMHRRNLATLAAANKMMFEGAQAIVQRQMELMQRQVSDLSEAAKTLAAPGGPQDKAVKQTELVKSAYEKSVGDARELEDLMRNSSTEALDMVHKRFLASLDELKAAVEKTKAAG